MVEKLLYTLLFLVLFTLSITCYGQDKPINHLIDDLNQYIEQKQIPGMMISIVQADRTIYEGGIGFANIEKKEKVTSEHLFRQGSISKSFTALGLYKLLENSPYNLQTPVNEIDRKIPFINKWEETKPLRIVHLLEHTSGFDDFHLHAIYNVKDTIQPPIYNMVKDHINSLHSRWQPGSKKAYSNPNYILAGHLIEVLSNKPFDETIKKKVLNPLHMASSGFYFKKPKNEKMAQGYRRISKQLIPLDFETINGSPAGDFCSTASDMASFLKAMLNRDSVLFKKQDYERIEYPETTIAAQQGLNFGYGLGNYTICKNEYLFHGHGGEIDGFASRYVYSREADLGIAISINRNGDANEIIDIILDYYINPTKSIRKNRTIELIPDSIIEKYEGFYEFNSPRNQLLSFSEKMFSGYILDINKDMAVRKRIFGRPKDTLYYAGNNQFYYKDEPVVSAIALNSDNDKIAFWINDSYTEKRSRLKRLAILFGVLFSVLILSSFFLFSLYKIASYFFSKTNQHSNQYTIIFGYGLILIIMFMGFGRTMNDMKNAASISFSSLTMYLSSYVLVLLSFLSLIFCLKLKSEKRLTTFYILASLSSIAITLYLWNIGFIGLRLWDY